MIAFFSMTLIMESVTLVLVPMVIFKSTVTKSLAIVGKKVIGIIPPKTELTVSMSAAIKPLRLRNRYSNPNLNIGVYILSLNQSIAR